MAEVYFTAPEPWKTVFYKSSGVAPAKAKTILTAAYVASDHVDVQPHQHLGVYVEWLLGDETTIEMQVDVSWDATTWFVAHILETPTSGVSAAYAHVPQFTAAEYTTTAMIYFSADIRGALYARARYKATGGTPTGSMTINLLGGI